MKKEDQIITLRKVISEYPGGILAQGCIMKIKELLKDEEPAEDDQEKESLLESQKS